MSCDTETCWDKLKAEINSVAGFRDGGQQNDITCIVNNGFNGPSNILELFSKYCPVCNSGSNDPDDIKKCEEIRAMWSGGSPLVKEASKILSDIVLTKIQNGLSKINRRLRNYFHNCNFGPDPVYNTFLNNIVPAILNEQFGEFMNICQSLNNISSPDGVCTQHEFCKTDLLGWAIPRPCVQAAMGYERSKYFNEDGTLTNEGVQVSAVYCDGITIYEALKKDENLECAAKFGTVIIMGKRPEKGELIITKDDKLVWSEPVGLQGGWIIYNSGVKEWRSAKERIKILNDIATEAAPKVKEKLQKIFPMFKDIISTAQNNRNKLYTKLKNRLQELINNPTLYDDLQFIATEQFFANMPQPNPTTIENSDKCGCAGEALWGPPGIAWDPNDKICGAKYGTNSKVQGIIWTDQNRQWDCYLEMRSQNAVMARDEKPTATITLTIDDCNLTMAGAKSLIASREAEPASQCASAEILTVDKISGENETPCSYTITYRFDPSKLWFPQETTPNPKKEGDICNNSELHTIMKLVVDLLNNSRSPGCGYSLFHFWVMNLIAGNNPLTEVFGFGSTVAGRNDMQKNQCSYSWPNENDNTRTTNQGAPSGPTSLPINCEVVPSFMGINNRSKLAWAAFFLILFFKYFNPRSSGVDAATNRMGQKMNEAINQIGACKPYVSSC